MNVLCALKLTELWNTSLLFDLNYNLNILMEASLLALAKSIYYVDHCHWRLGENLPPQENEVIIPFSSKHSAPLGDIWYNYSTYCRAVIAGQSNGFSGLFYLFLLWSSQVLKVFFQSNKKFLKKAFLKTWVAVQNPQRSWYRVPILYGTNWKRTTNLRA